MTKAMIVPPPLHQLFVHKLGCFVAAAALDEHPEHVVPVSPAQEIAEGDLLKRVSEIEKLKNKVKNNLFPHLFYKI